MKFLVITLSLYIVFFPGQLYSETLEPDVIEFRKIYSISEKTDSTQDQRKQVAEYIKDQCSYYDKKTPELSPSEDSWLMNEIDNGRIEAAAQTKEFQRRMLKNLLISCINASHKVINSKDIKTELTSWLEMVSFLILHNDVEFRIKNSNLNLTHDETLAFTSRLYIFSRNIVENFLIPMSKK